MSPRRSRQQGASSTPSRDGKPGDDPSATRSTSAGAARARIPWRRRISPEMTAGALSVIVLVLAGIVAGPSLAAGLGGSGGTAAPATPALATQAAAASVPPSVQATAGPTPAATPTPPATPEPTIEPTPAPTPEPTPAPTPEPTPVDAHVTLILTLNDRLTGIGSELVEAAGASSPDVAVIANALSRAAATIGVANDAARRLPAELAPVGEDLLAAYGGISDQISATLAIRRSNTSAYVRGARSTATAIRRLASLSDRLSAAAGQDSIGRAPVALIPGAADAADRRWGA